jgi:hypothetical protein
VAGALSLSCSAISRLNGLTFKISAFSAKDELVAKFADGKGFKYSFYTSSSSRLVIGERLSV